MLKVKLRPYPATGKKRMVRHLRLDPIMFWMERCGMEEDAHPTACT